MKGKRSPVWPVGVVVRGFLVLSWLWFTVPWLWQLGTVNGEACYQMTPAAARADLKSIRQRLAAGHDERMHALFPEGRLFSHSFYGFTLINLATANPQDAAFRRDTLAELERLIPEVESLGRAAPFEKCARLPAGGSAIATGHANLLRAGYAVLGGGDARILAAYHAQSQTLFAAFDASPVANLESYPGQVWPVDNLAALESLRLHDVLFGTHYTAAADRWAQFMTAHVEAASGLMNMQIGMNGEILDGPRGCALSWMLAFLPSLAPDLARQQYEIYRATWFGHPLGTTGIREFPAGKPAPFVDSDTGPIIFGFGTAATGFGIAAAKANGDAENLTGLLRALELCSFPTYSTNLSHSRFFGQVLLADELALWGKTLTRWDEPAQVRAGAYPPGVLKHFWVVLVVLYALGAAVTWLLVRGLVRAWRNCRQQARPLRGVHGALAVVAGVVLIGLAIIPAINWAIALLILAGIEVVERRWLGRAAQSIV